MLVPVVLGGARGSDSVFGKYAFDPIMTSELAVTISNAVIVVTIISFLFDSPFR